MHSTSDVCAWVCRGCAWVWVWVCRWVWVCTCTAWSLPVSINHGHADTDHLVAMEAKGEDPGIRRIWRLSIDASLKSVPSKL